jgi:hypothetical protein
MIRVGERARVAAGVFQQVLLAKRHKNIVNLIENIDFITGIFVSTGSLPSCEVTSTMLKHSVCGNEPVGCTELRELLPVIVPDPSAKVTHEAGVGVQISATDFLAVFGFGWLS